ncbi:putative hydroxyacylglutathione hydrolase, partial [Ochromonadaceae sp. CCMP2298]
MIKVVLNLLMLNSVLGHSSRRLSSATRMMAHAGTGGAKGTSLIKSTVSHSFADVHLVPMFDDNYGFIIKDKLGVTACVDPGDGAQMQRALEELGGGLDMILCTHKHMDHVGGNAALKQAFPDARVVGTRYERVPCLDQPVGEGDSFAMGALRVHVHHTPCHTKGHVVFLVSDGKQGGAAGGGAPLLFCGDTLFVGGCGRFFEGSALDMLANMDMLGRLPPDTTVFCAHEYTLQNLLFLASVDPRASEQLDRVRATRVAGRPTVPSSIGTELSYNLFMLCREARTQQLLGASSPEDAMARLRAMKNAF